MAVKFLDLSSSWSCNYGTHVDKCARFLLADLLKLINQGESQYFSKDVELFEYSNSAMVMAVRTKMQKVKTSKTTTLHVQCTFLYISLMSLHNYDVNCLISHFINHMCIGGNAGETSRPWPSP